MLVKEAMQKNIIKVPSTVTITEAAGIMNGKNIGSILISEGNKIIGIMTERDILRKVVAVGKNCEDTNVKEIMTSSLITIDSEDTLEKANELMAKNKIRRLVVIENNNIVGIITIRDVAERLRYSSAMRLTRSEEYSRISY